MKEYIIYARNFNCDVFRVKRVGFWGLFCGRTMTESEIVECIDDKKYKFYTKNKIEGTLTNVYFDKKYQLRTEANDTIHDNISNLPISYKLEK